MSFDALTANKYGLGPLIPVYLMYLAYQFKQVQDFRNKIIGNYISQMNLSKTNVDLQNSQEAQVQQTVKLIHTSRLAALGEMAAGIAHEVNNPLAIISGSLQQLDRKIDKKEFQDVETLKRHTDRSQKAILRITKIINGLRLFSQQTDALPKVVVSLHEIVDDTLNFCQEMLKARYLKLEIGNIPEVMLECHPVQISQVIINLIKNAEDALQDEKDENERWVKIVFESVHPDIQIHVSNGGPKISEEIQDRLFLPFFTTKGVGKGTGLGLSISRGIMKEHGGDLVFNEAQSKTTFTLNHPQAELKMKRPLAEPFHF
jgi:C4-dicarboxylate-specific signal transduction histidine kinase